MLELRDYFTKYFVVVKAKKEEYLDEAGKPTRTLAVGCRLRRLPQLPPGLRVLQRGVQRGVRKRKGQKKDQKRKERFTLQVNYLVIDIDLLGIKNYKIEFISKYNVDVWRNQTKGRTAGEVFWWNQRQL